MEKLAEHHTKYKELHTMQKEIRQYRALLNSLNKYIGGQQHKNMHPLLRIKEALWVLQDEIIPNKIPPQKEVRIKDVLEFRKQAGAAFNQADAIISILIKIRESERVNEAEAGNLSGR